jgi:RNA polymerase sigma factor (sigma-70 family)
MKIIAAMPTASRDVLLYRYVEEMSCAEISAVLGKTTRTVSKQLTRARRSLREGCKREGLSFED